MDATAGEQHRLAHLERFARHVDADIAGIGIVEHGGKQRGARGGRIAPRGEHRQRAREERPSHAEAQGIDVPASGDFTGSLDGREHALLEVVIPGQLP